jgi:hypothetical protein
MPYESLEKHPRRLLEPRFDAVFFFIETTTKRAGGLPAEAAAAKNKHRFSNNKSVHAPSAFCWSNLCPLFVHVSGTSNARPRPMGKQSGVKRSERASDKERERGREPFSPLCPFSSPSFFLRQTLLPSSLFFPNRFSSRPLPSTHRALSPLESVRHRNTLSPAEKAQEKGREKPCRKPMRFLRSAKEVKEERRRRRRRRRRRFQQRRSLLRERPRPRSLRPSAACQPVASWSLMLLVRVELRNKALKSAEG